MFVDLNEVEQCVRDMLKQYKLDKKVDFSWSNRFRKILGRFTYYERKNKLKPDLELSTKLVKLNLENRALIVETIRHEIAHALDYFERGFSRHDKRWKEIAYSIGSDGQTSSHGFFKIKELKESKP